MVFLIALGLFAALMSWFFTAYIHLKELHDDLMDDQNRLLDLIRMRNNFLPDFLARLALNMPEGDMLPRELRRMAEDSNCLVNKVLRDREFVDMACLLHSEVEILTQLHKALQQPSTDAYLEELGSRVNSVLTRQIEQGQRYNQMAALYNQTLNTFAGKCVGSMFDFRQAAGLSADFLRADKGTGH